MYIKPVYEKCPVTGKTVVRKVPDPDHGGFVPESGVEIQPHQYWLRRLEDGDIVEFIPTEPTEAPAHVE